jgi:hypothetical protein
VSALRAAVNAAPLSDSIAPALTILGYVPSARDHMEASIGARAVQTVSTYSARELARARLAFIIVGGYLRLACGKHREIA